MKCIFVYNPEEKNLAGYSGCIMLEPNYNVKDFIILGTSSSKISYNGSFRYE